MSLLNLRKLTVPLKHSLGRRIFLCEKGSKWFRGPQNRSQLENSGAQRPAPAPHTSRMYLLWELQDPGVGRTWGLVRNDKGAPKRGRLGKRKWHKGRGWTSFFLIECLPPCSPHAPEVQKPAGDRCSGVHMVAPVGPFPGLSCCVTIWVMRFLLPSDGPQHGMQAVLLPASPLPSAGALGHPCHSHSQFRGHELGNRSGSQHPRQGPRLTPQPLRPSASSSLSCLSWEGLYGWRWPHGACGENPPRT